MRELERRARRVDSLLNRSGFLLTGDAKILSMTSECLDKFKAGLCDAIYLADQLADLATQHPTSEYTKEAPTPADFAINLPNTNSMVIGHLARLTQRHRAQRALRRAQVAHLRLQPSRNLAWLVTLAAGGSKGFTRYSARMLESDPGLADARIMAFKEVLLRHGGSMVLWGFMRGSGTLAAFVRQAVTQCAEEVLFFEQYSDTLAEMEEEEEGEKENADEEMPRGLHMCIMGELNRRITVEKRAKAAENGESFDGDVSTREVWGAIDRLVGKEVGCETWSGYSAIKYPA